MERVCAGGGGGGAAAHRRRRRRIDNEKRDKRKTALYVTFLQKVGCSTLFHLSNGCTKEHWVPICIVAENGLVFASRCEVVCDDVFKGLCLERFVGGRGWVGEGSEEWCWLERFGAFLEVLGPLGGVVVV